jgi:hypothetical protein
MAPAQERIYGFPGFSADDMKRIRHGNAIELFPSVLDKIQAK